MPGQDPIAELLQRRLEDIGKTPYWLHKRSGVNYTTVTDYLTPGKVKRKDIATIMKLSGPLGIPQEDVVRAISGRSTPGPTITVWQKVRAILITLNLDQIRRIGPRVQDRFRFAVSLLIEEGLPKEVVSKELRITPESLDINMHGPDVAAPLVKRLASVLKMDEAWFLMGPHYSHRDNKGRVSNGAGNQKDA